MKKDWKSEKWLRREYKQNSRSLRSIADEVGRSPSYVSGILSEVGIETRDWGARPDTDQYKDKDWLQQKYHEKNLSGSEIAELCDTTKQTIYDWMRRHDIDRREKSDAAKLRVEKYPHTYGNPTEEFKQSNAWEMWSEEEREEFRERLSKERQGEGNPMWNVTGEDHHNYKENPTPQRFYQSARWRETREETLERDNHECQVCGATENLDVHHIRPVSAGGPRYELNNLIALCDSHHKEWEGLYLRPDTRGND